MTIYTKKEGFPPYVKFFNEDKISKIIFQDKATIVFLEDGTKGVARCSESDVYNEMIGFFVAYYRAMESSEINEFDMLLMRDFYLIIKSEEINGK